MAIVERAQEAIKAKAAFVTARGVGKIPLEDRDPDTGQRRISDCDYNNHGKPMNKSIERDIDLVAGVAEYNLANPDDAAFVQRIQTWLDADEDYRIGKYQIRLVVGGNAEAMPFPRYDVMKPEAVVTTIDAMLVGSGAENEDFLGKCARFELQLEEPRDFVLDAIERFGHDTGLEEGDGFVEEID